MTTTPKGTYTEGGYSVLLFTSQYEAMTEDVAEIWDAELHLFTVHSHNIHAIQCAIRAYKDGYASGEQAGVLRAQSNMRKALGYEV